jgi:hypothetical protein
MPPDHAAHTAPHTLRPRTKPLHMPLRRSSRPAPAIPSRRLSPAPRRAAGSPSRRPPSPGVSGARPRCRRISRRSPRPPCAAPDAGSRKFGTAAGSEVGVVRILARRNGRPPNRGRTVLLSRHATMTAIKRTNGNIKTGAPRAALHSGRYIREERPSQDLAGWEKTDHTADLAAAARRMPANLTTDCIDVV